MVADDPVASCWLCSAQNLVPTSRVQAWLKFLNYIHLSSPIIVCEGLLVNQYHPPRITEIQAGQGNL
ncbi:hypothetical protein MRB53_015580 [Persea americana]|uniref:Uncharacterized protein n=1 Tax=Persea americana TaxID=3435 RepID=A0ACC2M0N2_PERAE|nr:hypothetical protein MRB53_015580 [Persea americana]